MTSVLILKRSGTKDMLEMERAEWKPKTPKPWLPDGVNSTVRKIASWGETVGRIEILNK